MQIDDHTQVQPVFRSADVSNVGHPFCILLIGAKVSLQMIFDTRRSMTHVRLFPAALLGDSRKTLPLHQACYPILTALDTLVVNEGRRHQITRQQTWEVSYPAQGTNGHYSMSFLKTTFACVDTWDKNWR